MMRENATNGRDLIRPSLTRFALNFITLESLLKYRYELIDFFNSREYLEYCNKNLRNESFKTLIQVNHLVGDKNIWNRISYYLKLVEPLVQVLRMIDGDNKNDMRYLYETMGVAKERIKKKNLNAYQKCCEIVDRRWEMTLHHSLHTARKYIIQLLFLTNIAICDSLYFLSN